MVMWGQERIGHGEIGGKGKELGKENDVMGNVRRNRARGRHRRGKIPGDLKDKKGNDFVLKKKEDGVEKTDPGEALSPAGGCHSWSKRASWSRGGEGG